MDGVNQVVCRSWASNLFALRSAAGVTVLGLSLAGAAQRLTLPRAFALYAVHPGGAPGSGNHAAQGYLGVIIRDVSEEQSSQLKLGANTNQPRGAEILYVDHDGPAGKAGLREHDVILIMNGQAIEGGDPLRRMLRETPPGRTVTLVISRDGQQQTIAAEMANHEEVERLAWQQHVAVVEAPATPPDPMPPGQQAADRHGSSFFSSSSRASRNFLGSITLSPGYTGAILEAMAPQLAEFFGAQGKTGLLVRSVDSNSPAAAAGLRAGDVVVRVNNIGITASGDWLRAVRENKGKAISVVVLRDRREQTLTMIPNAKHHSSLLPDLWPHLGSGARSQMVPASTQPEQVCALPDTFSM